MEYAITFFLLLVVVFMMSSGVLMGRSRLRGSCGGVGAKAGSCGVCGSKEEGVCKGEGKV
jgi:hypothetical protein